MKRLFTLLSVFLLINVFAFSNFFSSRFFEIKAGADVSLSNNALSLNDVMKKNLVIDLRKMADECPDSGMNIIASVKPAFEMNLNLKVISFGLSSGLDFYEKFDVGKGIFDFLGYGNFIGQPFVSAITNNTEIYYYSQANLGLNIGKFKIHVKPAMFMPALVIKNSGGTATILNNQDGTISVSTLMNMEIFTPLTLTSKDGKITVDDEDLMNKLITGLGFDLAGSLRFPLFSWFDIEAEARIPLIPGRITQKYVMNTEYSYETKILEIGNNTGFDVVPPSVSSPIETYYMSNRPLKAAVYLDKDFIGKLMNLRAGLGFGLRRPFTDDYLFYPEYYVGFTVNILDIAKIGISTQYRDQVFIHQLGTTVNVRIIQLDLGASLQSADFRKSFAFAGFGAYAFVTVGF